MKNMHKLGIYLNDEPGDKEALQFAGLIARLVQPEYIHCISVRGLENTPSSTVPELEAVRAKAMEVLSPDLTGRIQLQVCEATGLGEILRTAQDLDLDMIVVGRHLPHEQLGLGRTFYRLARKAPCDVLVVPVGAHPHLNRLLVLVDGSEHSRMALKKAIEIARASGGRPQVVVQSVYCVNYGYQYTGKSFEDAVRHFEALTRKQIEQSIEDIDVSGVDFEIVCTCSNDISASAHDLTAAKNMDAIVIGSRGATLPAIALLGATAERVLLNAPVPVMVIKRKGETFRFLDAVLAEFQEAR